MKANDLPGKIVLLLIVLAAGYFGLLREQEVSQAQVPQSQTSSVTKSSTGLVERAFKQRLSNLQVTVDGSVIKLLPDDRDGSRHQRFILRLDSGLTLLVAHNIDLAPRVDGLAKDDSLSIHGEYEWSEKGGVIHWTHHDPRGNHPDGWIRHQGRLYQ